MSAHRTFQGDLRQARFVLDRWFDSDRGRRVWGAIEHAAGVALALVMLLLLLAFNAIGQDATGWPS